MTVIHFYSLYENNVSGIPSGIMDYIETSYDKLLLELYYTYRTEAVSVITAQQYSSRHIFFVCTKGYKKGKKG